MKCTRGGRRILKPIFLMTRVINRVCVETVLCRNHQAAPFLKTYESTYFINLQQLAPVPPRVGSELADRTGARAFDVQLAHLRGDAVRQGSREGDGGL